MDNKQGGIEDTGSMLMRPNGQDLPDVERKAKVQKAITESMNELVKAGHRLILVYPSPEMGWDVPAKINEETRGMDEAKLREWSSKSHFSIEWKVFEERTKRAFAAFDNVPDSKNVIRVYPDKALCDKDACYAHRQDNVFYGDDDHLSQYGATILSQEILKASE